MSKDLELTYEEQVRKEFEQTQEQTETDIKEKNVVDLGRVDLRNKTSEDFYNDDDIKRINSTIGFHDVPLDMLPSQGKYYPENTRISIRAARVGEIREFSTIDEENVKDVTDKLTYIISQCVRIYYGNVQGHYKDILVADRIVLILKIRELTFIDGQQSIKIPVPSGSCSTAGCKPQSEIYFDSTKLQFMKQSPELEKYYDPVERCYRITTKHFGIIKLYIPTIGITTSIGDWIVEQQQKRNKVDASLAEILQFVIKDWRGLGEKEIFNKLSELAGWDTQKFTLVYRLIEKLNVGIEFDIIDTCEQCGGEIKVPISFPNGYKSIFVPTVDDFGDELL